MKVVIDTNVLMAGVIADGVVRSVLFAKEHVFLLPEHALVEVQKHLPVIVDKSGLNDSEVEQLINGLAKSLIIVPEGDINAKWDEAVEIMKDIDTLDIPFIAAALATDADGIWSFDDDFKRQSRIRVFSTSELLV